MGSAESNNYNLLHVNDADSIGIHEYLISLRASRNDVIPATLINEILQKREVKPFKSKQDFVTRMIIKCHDEQFKDWIMRVIAGSNETKLTFRMSFPRLIMVIFLRPALENPNPP